MKISSSGSGRPASRGYNRAVARRPPPHDRPKRNDADAVADAEAFANAMADVKRLAPDARGRVRPERRVSPIVTGDKPNRNAPTTSVTHPPDDDDVGSGFAAPGVDRREVRRLKRGDYEPGDRLDLHGMTGAEAVDAVTHFIERARSRWRCVAIVHGRGLHSQGGVPVLKTRVRAGLRQLPAVLAFADAPRRVGGDGAVYVLLRK